MAVLTAARPTGLTIAAAAAAEAAAAAATVDPALTKAAGDEELEAANPNGCLVGATVLEGGGEETTALASKKPHAAVRTRICATPAAEVERSADEELAAAAALLSLRPASVPAMVEVSSKKRAFLDES